MKRQAVRWEKIFANQLCKDLYVGYVKNSQNIYITFIMLVISKKQIRTVGELLIHTY